MITDFDFISYLLAFIILNLFLLSIYQNNQNNQINSNFIVANTTSKQDKLNCTNQHLKRISVSNCDKPLGPVINFHQSFQNKKMNELGWRNFYNKYNTYKVKDIDNFKGTKIRNYLNNMNSTNNIYRNC